MVRQQSGFTLVELLVTVSIVGTLMVLAVPSFITFMQNAQLSDTVGNFTSATNAARANSMKFGTRTFLVQNDSAIGWSSGWYVYSDKNWNNTYDAASDEIVVRHEAIPNGVTFTVTGVAGGVNSLFDGYLLFNGSGFPQLKAGGFANGRAVIASSTRSTSVVFDQTGRVRTCTTGSTGC